VPLAKRVAYQVNMTLTAIERLLPSPRMSLFIRRAQIGGADVRVNLRRDEAFVAEKLLYAADVSAAVQKVGGEAVAERVRRRALVEAVFFDVFFEHPGHAAAGQPSAELVCEYWRLTAGLFARRQRSHF
jgi:hypothetical protein